MKSDLRGIPGGGGNKTEDLIVLGLDSAEALKGQNPLTLYQKDCVKGRFTIDRYQLYVCRGAVYYAETEPRDPEKLK